MVAQEAGAVGAGEEGQHLLQSGAEVGDGHVGAADETVAGADDGADSRSLPVRGEPEVDAGGERRAEHGQQEHIQQQRQHVADRKIPAHAGQIAQAHRRSGEGDDEGGGKAGDVVAHGHGGRAHGRDGEVVAGTAGLVLYHQQIGAEGHGDAAHRQQGGHQLAAYHTVEHAVSHGGARLLQSGAEGVVKHLLQKGGVQHQQDHRGDEGRVKHALILEIELYIAPDQRTKSCHFSSPPVSFLPVTARNTSSILPLVIS